MANRRTSMGKIRELLRLDEKCGLSNRQIARALNIPRPVARNYLISSKLSGITYQSITTMGDDEVVRTLETRKKENCEGYRIFSERFTYLVKERPLHGQGVTIPQSNYQRIE